MNKGILLAAGGGVLLLLAGVASAATAEPEPALPPPPPPSEPTIEQYAAAIKKHRLYAEWREAHNVCVYPPRPDPNDPNSINVIQKLQHDACYAADERWSIITKDLNIPEDKWDDIAKALGV